MVREWTTHSLVVERNLEEEVEAKQPDAGIDREHGGISHANPVSRLLSTCLGGERAPGEPPGNYLCSYIP